MIRLADGGEAAKVNVLAGVTANAEALMSTALPAVTVIGPLADPAAMVKVREVDERMETGCTMVPPPCFGMDTSAAAAKLLAVSVTEVPIGPDFGLKSEAR